MRKSFYRLLALSPINHARNGQVCQVWKEEEKKSVRCTLMLIPGRNYVSGSRGEQDFSIDVINRVIRHPCTRPVITLSRYLVNSIYRIESGQ